jgi:hypothetical protein
VAEELPEKGLKERGLSERLELPVELEFARGKGLL